MGPKLPGEEIRPNSSSSDLAARDRRESGSGLFLPLPVSEGDRQAHDTQLAWYVRLLRRTVPQGAACFPGS